MSGLINTCPVDTTLTVLYLIFGARSDLFALLLRDLELQPLVHAFSLLHQGLWVPAKRIWAQHCNVSQNPDDWWDDLRPFLLTPLCKSRLFRVKIDTEELCDRACAFQQPSPSTYITMGFLQSCGMKTVLADLVVNALAGTTSASFCELCKSGFRRRKTTLDVEGNVVLCIDFCEKSFKDLGLLAPDVRFPHPHQGAIYDLAAVICCNSSHFTAFIRVLLGAFTHLPEYLQSASSSSQPCWIYYDGLSETRIRLDQLKLPPRGRCWPVAALYVKR